MLQLLQPVWLFALAGISIPVIIHLWNQQPGKTLKVGSIAFVPENSKEYRRRLQLYDLLLLLLRCLLIALVSFALAKPLWRVPLNNAKEKGWVMISRQNTASAYVRFKPVIDSLTEAGLAFHYFSEGFQKAALAEAVKKQNDTPGLKTASYRNLIASLDEQVPQNLPLYLFTDNLLEHFAGTRPSVSLNLQWFTYTPLGTAVPRSNMVKTGDTAFYITLFTDKYKKDAAYIKAAIDAIRQYSKKNIRLFVTNNVAEIPAKQHWLFWLSDLPVKPGIQTKNLLAYENGILKKTASWINETGKNTDAPVQLYQSFAAGDANNGSSKNIWEDGFGNPVLSAEKRDSIHYYHCYTHFDPAWNELPWSSSFPEMIYKLLEAGEEKIAIPGQRDTRIIDSSQLLPEFIKAGDNLFKKQVKLFSTVDLSFFSWLAVLILFFTERLVSFQFNKPVKND